MLFIHAEMASYVNPITLTNTTLQFIRFATLLKNAQYMMEEGSLDEDMAIQVLLIVRQLSRASPELVSIQGQLNSLLHDGKITLDTRTTQSESDIKNYGQRLFDFVAAAMDFEEKFPVSIASYT